MDEHVIQTERRLATLEVLCQGTDRRLNDRMRELQSSMELRFEHLGQQVARAVTEASHTAQQSVTLLIGEERASRDAEREQRAKLIEKLNTATYIADVLRAVPRYVWPVLTFAALLMAVSVAFRLQLPEEIATLFAKR